MKRYTGLWGKLYIALILLLLYLPIGVVVAYSFNASKSTAAWGGFTLDWYIFACVFSFFDFKASLSSMASWSFCTPLWYQPSAEAYYY